MLFIQQQSTSVRTTWPETDMRSVFEGTIQTPTTILFSIHVLQWTDLTSSKHYYSVHSIMVKSGKLLWVPFNPIITRTVESARRSFLISHQTQSMREQPPPLSPSSKRPPLYVRHRHGYCRRTVSLLELLAFLSTLSTVAKLLALPSIRLERNTSFLSLKTTGISI